MKKKVYVLKIIAYLIHNIILCKNKFSKVLIPKDVLIGIFLRYESYIVNFNYFEYNVVNF